MPDVSTKHLWNCPIAKANIQVADDIISPNLGSLKGKTVHHPIPHVNTASQGVLWEIMKVHMAITLAVDIMFVNKIPFLVTISQDIRFGTVKALIDGKVPTVVQNLRSITLIYKHHGFQIETILADPEFEATCPWFPGLSCCGADEHIPDIEQFIHTI